MRRALRSLALVALGTALVALGTGTGLLRLLRRAAGDGSLVADALSGLPRFAHAATGHAAAIVACLVAAIAFVLGLQGLLEAGGRKASAALLFVLGPALMALALAAEFSGRIDREVADAGLVGIELERVARGHAAMVAPALCLGLLAVAAIGVLLLREREGVS